MIESILPISVSAVECRGDVSGVDLFPEEEKAVRNAVAKRQREFATVRVCARQALAQLGYESVSLAPGELGSPEWPTGVAGSMTHCDGYRAAAVARLSDVSSIGIDAEPAEPLPEGVLGLVARREEWNSLDELTREFSGTPWGRVLFSAKEAIYKAWFPITRQVLGFEDAIVDIDPESDTFRARVCRDARALPRDFHGSWLVEDGLVVTAVAV